MAWLTDDERLVFDGGGFGHLGANLVGCGFLVYLRGELVAGFSGGQRYRLCARHDCVQFFGSALDSRSLESSVAAGVSRVYRELFLFGSKPRVFVCSRRGVSDRKPARQCDRLEHARASLARGLCLDAIDL